MKAVIFSAAFLLNVTAHAATAYVNPNIFTASGPATVNYFSNLNSLTAEVKKVSAKGLEGYSFAGASVDTETKAVTYDFSRMESETVVEVCWSNLRFTAVEKTEGPVISNVKATLNCQKNQD